MKQYTFHEVKNEHALSGGCYKYEGFEFTGQHDKVYNLKLFLLNLRLADFDEQIKPFIDKRHMLFEIALHLKYINYRVYIAKMKPLFDKYEWQQITVFKLKRVFDMRLTMTAMQKVDENTINFER